MNRKQSNHYSMMLATDRVLSKYPEDVDSVEAFAKNALEFKNRLQVIKDVLLIQEGKITGTSAQKQIEEQEMIDTTIRVAAGIYVYAIDHADFELAEKVDISPSSMQRMKQITLQTACLNVLELAKSLEGNLGGYGISTEDITVLDKEINDYVSIMAKPRTEIVSRSEATQRLEVLIKEQLNLLNKKLDKLALMFKNSNATFYNEYKSARIIVNLGKRHEEDDEDASA